MLKRLEISRFSFCGFGFSGLVVLLIPPRLPVLIPDLLAVDELRRHDPELWVSFGLFFSEVVP